MVVADMKLGTFRGELAVAVECFQIIGPRFDGGRQPDRQQAVGDVIVVTGLGSCSPLVQSTSTTFALTMRFRWLAEMTRFSIKLTIGFIPKRQVRGLINYKLWSR